jgi:hypothetical protein
MRNQFHAMTADETARADAARTVILDAVRDDKSVEFLYFKEKTGETTRRTGKALDVFSSGSKESAFIEHEDGTKKSYNLRNILRIKFAE